MKKTHSRQKTERAPTDLNSAQWTGPDLSPLVTAASMAIHLVPCESQPPSCARVWTVKTRKKYAPFFSGRKCKIIQEKGTQVDAPFFGEFFQTKDKIRILGKVRDGAPEGEDFELVLSSFMKPDESFYDDKRLAMAGFLQRGEKCKEPDFEITHDAFVYTKTMPWEVHVNLRTTWIEVILCRRSQKKKDELPAWIGAPKSTRKTPKDS